MADPTASFVDPVYLARFGLNRTNALDYFLHPLNPFRTKAKTSNEMLQMQGIHLAGLHESQMQQRAMQGKPYDPIFALATAEDEFLEKLSKLVGEQYELLRVDSMEDFNSNLFVIRHVIRSDQTNMKILGIYYIVEGAIYKSPPLRALMKANVSRVQQALSDSCDILSSSTRYDPSVGYTWDFTKRKRDSSTIDGEILLQRQRAQKRIKIMESKRSSGGGKKKTEEEEEGERAAEAIDNILLRLRRKLNS